MSELNVQPVFLPQEPHRRFTAATILIPFAFIALHFVVTMLATILYLVGSFVVQAISGSADFMALWQDPNALMQDITDHYPIITVIMAAGLIPVYAIYLMLKRRRDPRTVWLESPHFTAILPALAVMIGLLGVSNLWLTALTALGRSLPFIQQALNDYNELANAFNPTSGLLWLFLGVSVLAPVTEELLFRGIVQGELRKAMPEWLAIVLQALIFAAYHMQLVQSSYVILPGLMLGFAYYWTRSLWVPIAMHIGFNFVGSVLPAIIGSNELFGNVLGFTELGFILVGAVSAVYLFKTRRPARAGDFPAVDTGTGRQQGG
jgi:uncharacterized protein